MEFWCLGKKARRLLFLEPTNTHLLGFESARQGNFILKRPFFLPLKRFDEGDRLPDIKTLSVTEHELRLVFPF